MTEEEGVQNTSEKEDEAPRDAHVMAAILKAMGVEHYESRVINQLLELMYRYVSEVLDDARVYGDHAGKPEIDLDDVKLAIQSRISYSFTQPPSREVLLQLSRERNSIPLPIIEDKVGIQLPPEKHQLTAQNYQIKAEPKPETEKAAPVKSEPANVSAPTAQSGTAGAPNAQSGKASAPATQSGMAGAAPDKAADSTPNAANSGAVPMDTSGTGTAP